MTDANEEEWEYEYDENETEDLYIPLDLTNIPAAQIPMVSQGRPGHPTLLKTRLRALNAARGQPIEFATRSSNGQDTATMGEVQIIGLHTTNPLIMYNGQLLSCHWGSTIGTDMFFVKPGSMEDGKTEPMRSLPSVDLLSLGSTKLLAKVGRLKPRDDLFDDTQTERAESAALNKHESANSTAGEDIAATDEIPEENIQPAPDSFLAKLNQVKAKRGESTRLAISKTSNGTRLVSEPSNQDTPQ